MANLKKRSDHRENTYKSTNPDSFNHKKHTHKPHSFDNFDHEENMRQIFYTLYDNWDWIWLLFIFTLFLGLLLTNLKKPNQVGWTCAFFIISIYTARCAIKGCRSGGFDAAIAYDNWEVTQWYYLREGLSPDQVIFVTEENLNSLLTEFNKVFFLLISLLVIYAWDRYLVKKAWKLKKKTKVYTRRAYAIVKTNARQGVKKKKMWRNMKLKIKRRFKKKKNIKINRRF